MAAFVFKDGSLVVNSVDLSDHVRSMTLNYSGDLQEETSMGDDTRKRLSGLKDWSVDVTFKQDFDSGSVDATLFSLIGAASFTVTMKPTSAAVSATNPSFSGSAVLETYPPLDGAVGDLAEVSATFQAAGDLTRAT